MKKCRDKGGETEKKGGGGSRIPVAAAIKGVACSRKASRTGTSWAVSVAVNSALSSCFPSVFVKVIFMILLLSCEDEMFRSAHALHIKYTIVKLFVNTIGLNSTGILRG